MPTLTEEINSSFSDSGDKNVDALNDEIHYLRYVEGIIRMLRQEKEAIHRAMILSKYPIKLTEKARKVIETPMRS